MAWVDLRLKTLNLAFESHPCGLCEDDVDFTTKAVLDIHKLEVHQDSKELLVFQCDVCGIEFRKNECVHQDKDVRIHDPYTAVIGDKTCYFPTFSDLCECHSLRCKRVKAQIERGGYFKGEEYGEYDPYVSCILCWLKFPCFTDDVQDHYRNRHQLENFQNVFACRYCHKTVAPQQSPFGPLSEVSKEYILEVKAFAKAHKICKQLVPEPLNSNWQCKKCGQEFNNALSFFRHQMTHSGKKVIQCQRCPERFLHPAQYDTHFKTHMYPKIFYCGSCPEHFNSYLPLKMHMREHAQLMHFRCQICGLTVKDFNSHLRNHIWESKKLPVPANLQSIYKETQSKTESHLKFQCFTCEEYFFKASALGLHYRESHEMIENLQFRCPYCFQEFSRSDTAAINSADKTTYPYIINGHAEIEFTTFSKWCDHHVTNCDSTMKASETIFKCCKCIKLCVSERQLFIHTENHYKHLPKECPACSYTSTSIQEMEEHLKKHNMIRVFKDHYYCRICFGFFQSKETSIGSGSFLREEKDAFLKFVESHALCDSESRQPSSFCSCEICQESFGHPEQLFQHEIRKHTNRYAVFCFQCGAGCLSSSDLQQHTEHLGGEFSCRECFVEFSSAQDLEKHIVLLAKNGLYFCEDCDEEFDSPEDIANHCKNTHVEEKLLCHYCNEMLGNKYFLSQHILHLHRKVNESRVEGHRKLALELGLISAWELQDQGKNVKKRKRKLMENEDNVELIQNLATNGCKNLNTVFKVEALDYINQEDDDETESSGMVKKRKEENQPSAVHGTGDEIQKEPAFEQDLITTKELWKKAKKARLKKKKLMKKQANKEFIQNLATTGSENQNKLLTLIPEDCIKREKNDETGCSGPARKRRGENIPSSVHGTEDEIHKESALELGLISASERKRAKRARQRKRKSMQKNANKELIQNIATNSSENQNNLLTLIAPDCIKQEANDETECQGPLKKKRGEDLQSAAKQELLIPSNCDICEQVFQNSIILDLHIREIHASEADLEFICVCCQLKFHQADYIVQAENKMPKFKYPIFSDGLEEIHFYKFSDFIDHHAQVCRSMTRNEGTGACSSITNQPAIVGSPKKKKNLLRKGRDPHHILLRINMPAECPLCLFQTIYVKEMWKHLSRHNLFCLYKEYYFCKRCLTCYLPQRSDLGTGRFVPEERNNFLSFATAHASCGKKKGESSSIFFCRFCESTKHFDHPLDLFEHEIEEHTKAFPLVCADCKEGVLSMRALNKHIKEHPQHHSAKEVKQNLLRLCFSDKLKPSMPSVCPICSVERAKAGKLRNHLVGRHHLVCAHQEYYFCKYCLACYLPERPDLGTGRLVPEERDNFLSFATAHASCKKEDRNEANIPPCKFCQPTNHIRNPRDLFKHEICEHTKAFPWVCEECKEGFLLLNELMQHKNVHQQHPPSKKARKRVIRALRCSRKPESESVGTNNASELPNFQC